LSTTHSASLGGSQVKPAAMASFDDWAADWATGLEDMAGEAVMNAVGFVLQGAELATYLSKNSIGPIDPRIAAVLDLLEPELLAMVVVQELPLFLIKDPELLERMWSSASLTSSPRSVCDVPSAGGERKPSPHALTRAGGFEV
jgi:hypothetical protein